MFPGHTAEPNGKPLRVTAQTSRGQQNRHVTVLAVLAVAEGPQRIRTGGWKEQGRTIKQDPVNRVRQQRPRTRRNAVPNAADRRVIEAIHHPIDLFQGDAEAMLTPKSLARTRTRDRLLSGWAMRAITV